MTLFDDAIALTPDGENAVTAHTHPAWGNMVGPFGGITAATALAAVQAHPDAIGEPAALTVNFAGPLTEGPWRLRVRPVRTNRSNQHWLILGEQDGQTVLTGTALLALPHRGWEAQDAVMPVVDAPEAYPVAEIERTSEWLNRYRMRFVSGGLPGPTPTGDAESICWLSQTELRPWDHAAIAAAADASFPRIFLHTGMRAATGTVSMTTYFHDDAEVLAGTPEQLLLQAAASRFSEGMFDQHARLFAPDGRLVATSHQTVYYKVREP
ncbi:acyl-CoA thioesterase [Microbacterium gorillae]|uniref:acyl-CoA thioesterase n=1 Tax=Microbacterium gorillae TaxID=1231063 RepID=UPI00058FD433|nr:thioesterase family protein [Microbacterium gorillae]